MKFVNIGYGIFVSRWELVNCKKIGLCGLKIESYNLRALHAALERIVNITLFRNKRFMLDEIVKWNASKFAIILE